MKIKFKDLFNRAVGFSIGYHSFWTSSVQYWYDGGITFRSIPSTCHCTTGPARTNINGTFSYWIDGRQVDVLEFII